MICVGIDIAKGKSTVCFLKPGGEVLVAPYEVAHTKDELGRLLIESMLMERRFGLFLKIQAITIGL